MSTCSLSALLAGAQPLGSGPQLGGHFSLLAAALESIEARSELLATRLAAAEAEAALYKARLAESADALSVMSARLESSSTAQQAQQREVSRLSALLEAAQLQESLSKQQLLCDLADARVRAQQLRAVRDDALLQRDDALLELANAYADIDAMQSTLADSALYVRQLRRRVAELEDAAATSSQQQRQQQQATGRGGSDQDAGVFSLASIKASIQAAVDEAAAQPEAERKRQIRALQLRWHPDKNPVMKEWCSEVTKLLNSAVAALEERAAV